MLRYIFYYSVNESIFNYKWLRYDLNYVTINRLFDLIIYSFENRLEFVN